MIKVYDKLKYIISNQRRKQLIVLIISLLFGMVLEIFGLGIILPVLAIILDENMMNNFPFVINKFAYFGLNDYKKISVTLIILLPIIYLIKTIFLIIISFFQNKFVHTTTRDVTDKLFKNYLCQPYESFVSRNSSEYIKVLQIEVMHFTTYIQALIILITEFALSISVLFVFIWIEPIGAITISLFFGLLSVIFYQLSKSKLKTWGRKRESFDKSISKIIIEALGNIREVKIFEVINFFTSKLNFQNIHRSKITYFQSTLIQAPRFYLEFISVLALSIFILLFLIQDKNIVELISTIGVFVAGSFRVIPSLNRILSARQHLKYHENTLDVIYNELQGAFDDIKEELLPIRFNKKICFSNISFKYLGTEKYILEKINLDINKGSLIGVIGHSGSGKSTLIDILSGLLKPQSGEISIDNKKLDFDNYNLSRIIGYVSQRTNLLDNTIVANIAFGESEPNIEQVKNALIDSQLMEFVNTLSEGIYTKIGENGVNFSGGQIQRISIARALYRKPQILIFDEATSSLDNKTESKLIESIEKLKGKITIIMVAHRLTSLNKCDYVYELKNSKFILKNIMK